MLPRNLPPIGTKNDCAVEIAFYDTVTTVCFIVCFQKLFLRVFFYFSVKMCVFILLFYSVTSTSYVMCVISLFKVCGD